MFVYCLLHKCLKKYLIYFKIDIYLWSNAISQTLLYVIFSLIETLGMLHTLTMLLEGSPEIISKFYVDVGCHNHIFKAKQLKDDCKIRLPTRWQRETVICTAFLGKWEWKAASYRAKFTKKLCVLLV